MKKLLLFLLLFPILAFSQATGYDLSNFATSGSIGTASSTVDVYSRININQTTPSITLTVPKPTNTTTKVTEVWIANKGTVSFNLRPLPDTTSFQLDTGKFVILKWIGARYAIIRGVSSGSGGVTSVFGRTGSVTATSGDYTTAQVTESGNLYYTDARARGSVSATAPITYNSTTGTFGATIAGVSTNGYITSTNFSDWYKKTDSTNTTVFLRRDGNSLATTGKLWMGSFQGLTWDNPAGSPITTITGSSSSGYVNVRGNNYTIISSNNSSGEVARITNLNGWYNSLYKVGTGNYQDTIPNKSGTFAMTSDIPSVAGYVRDTTKLSINGVQYDLSASRNWTIGNATNLTINGTGGNGYIRLNNQSASPTAFSGAMLLYTNSSNQLVLARRNNANSADIQRVLGFPDNDIFLNFQNPASGTSVTVANTNTAQTFTEQNIFSNTSGQNIWLLNIRDQVAGTYKNALTSTSSGVLLLGNGFSSVQVGSIQGSNISGGIFSNSIQGSTSGGLMRIGSFDPGGTINIGTIALATTVNSVSKQNTTTILSVDNTGSGGTGDIFLKTGTNTGGGTRGSLLYSAVNYSFNVSAAPTYNSMVGGFYDGNATTVPTGNPTSGYYRWSSSGNPYWRTSSGIVIGFNNGIALETVGAGLSFKTGSNARVGTSTLSSGTITVANTSVTANTKVKVQLVSVNGGTLGVNYTYTVNPGVGFTINSVSSVGTTVATDTAILDWYLTEFN